MTDNTDPLPMDPEPIPEIEDANAPNEPDEQSVTEDDVELLDASARALEPADDSVSSEPSGAPSAEQPASPVAVADDTSDTAAIVDDQKPANADKQRLPDWSNERSGHRIAVELKHVESRVRQLLENNDTRRKRRLGGTRRWQELQEDILAWRFSGRPDEATLAELHALIAKRNHLYDRIVFLSTIRPGWREQLPARKS